MNRQETTAWLQGIFPAPLTFAEVGGWPVGTAALDNGENLAVTVTFADIDTGLQSQDPADATVKDVRCELFSIARGPQEEIAQFLSEAAELLKVAQVVPAQPGTLLPKLGPNRHGMLIAPYVWGGQTPQVKEPHRWTLALQLVALTDSEYAYAVEEGVPAFQQAVAESGIDLLDWQRMN